MDHLDPKSLAKRLQSQYKHSMLMDCESPAKYLESELARRMSVNARYSLRAFARTLTLSPGELSEVLRGKRALSVRSAWRVAKKLGLNATESRQLVEMAAREQMGQEGFLSESKLARRELSLDLFNVIADWYCLGILNLSECEGFRWDPPYIARRLGISVPQVRVAIDRLKRIGLIESEGNAYRVCRDYVISPDGIPADAIRKYHREMLQKAAQSLELQKIEDRANFGLGFAADPKDLPAMKKEVSAFLDELIEKYSKGKRRREVFHCELALFKLTEKT